MAGLFVLVLLTTAQQSNIQVPGWFHRFDYDVNGQNKSLTNLASVVSTNFVGSGSGLTNLGGVVNVRDFGATGNGSTDDRAAVQAAIDSAIANSKPAVFFPPGTYKFNSFTATGVSQYRCHLLFGATNGAATKLSLYGQNAVLLSDLKTAGTNTTFIATRNWSDSVVDGLTFRSTVATAGSTVNNLGKLDGIAYFGNTAPTTSGKNITIEDCIFEDCSQSIHWVGNSTTAVSPVAFENLKVLNCTFLHSEGQDTGGQTAIRLATTDINWSTFANNYFDGCTSGTCGAVGRPKDGLLITHGNYNKVVGNVIRRYSYEAVALFAYGTIVHPNGTAAQDLVANNLFQNPNVANDTTGSGGYSIVVQRPNTIIRGNTFQEIKRGVQTQNLDSYTITANLTMPAVGSNVTVNVSDNSKLVVGEITDVGNSLFELISKPTGQAELKNLGLSGNVQPGVVISSGASLHQPYLYGANLSVIGNQFIMQGGTFNQLWAIYLPRSEGSRVIDNDIFYPDAIGNLGSDTARGIGVQITRSITIQGNKIRANTKPDIGPLHGIYFVASAPRSAFVSGNRFENLTSGIGGLASVSTDSVIGQNYFSNCDRNVMASAAGGANGETGPMYDVQTINWIPTSTGWWRLNVSGCEALSGQLAITADSYYNVASGAAPASGTSKFTDILLNVSGSRLDPTATSNKLQVLRYVKLNGGAIDAVRLVYDSTGIFVEVNVASASTFRPIVLRLDTAQRGFLLREPITDPGGSTGIISVTLADSLLPSPSPFVAVPATPTSTGLPGQLAYSTNYLYVCPETNVWRRTPISTWTP